jgi:hypothetical protein
MPTENRSFITLDDVGRMVTMPDEVEVDLGTGRRRVVPGPTYLVVDVFGESRFNRRLAVQVRQVLRTGKPASAVQTVFLPGVDSPESTRVLMSIA